MYKLKHLLFLNKRIVVFYHILYKYSPQPYDDAEDAAADANELLV